MRKNRVMKYILATHLKPQTCISQHENFALSKNHAQTPSTRMKRASGDAVLRRKGARGTSHRRSHLGQPLPTRKKSRAQVSMLHLCIIVYVCACVCTDTCDSYSRVLYPHYLPSRPPRPRETCEPDEHNHAKLTMHVCVSLCVSIGVMLLYLYPPTKPHRGLRKYPPTRKHSTNMSTTPTKHAHTHTHSCNEALLPEHSP